MPFRAPRLAAALKSWTENPAQSLAQWLKQSAGLDDARIRALECLAAAHLKTHQNDLRLSLDAWNAYELTQDVLTEIHDDALRTTLSTTLGGNTTLPLDGGSHGRLSASWVLNPASPSCRGRALSTDPAARQRRNRAGLAGARLRAAARRGREGDSAPVRRAGGPASPVRARGGDHGQPGTPRDRSGVQPGTKRRRPAVLRDAVHSGRELLGGDPAVSPGPPRTTTGGAQDRARGRSWGIEFRQLLGRFLDVCDAMDYAHSRGVLHRDLKPANIMLGRYGETLVVDWGLAKVIGKNDVMPAQADGEFEPSFAGASVTSSGETQQGTTIGTPSYMSPEQARGAIDQLGPASDVYSLGATLYELLTGQVAFPGKKVSEVIEKVLKGEFPPPRAVDRSIPAPLEAICLKAMAGSPSSVIPRCARWRRTSSTGWPTSRSRLTPSGGSSGSGAGSASTEPGPTRPPPPWSASPWPRSIGVVVIEGARRRRSPVRKEAETNFNMAQTAVDDYLTSVSENTLLKQQDSVDIRSLRQELLNNALSYYKSFVNQRSNDPRLRRQLANAYFRVGEITREIDSRQRGDRGVSLGPGHLGTARRRRPDRS